MKKLFRVEMMRVSYVLAEDALDAEAQIRYSDNFDEATFEVGPVKKTAKPDAGWDEGCLVYGRHSEDITFGAAVKKYGVGK